MYPFYSNHTVMLYTHNKRKCVLLILNAHPWTADRICGFYLQFGTIGKNISILFIDNKKN